MPSPLTSRGMTVVVARGCGSMTSCKDGEWAKPPVARTTPCRAATRCATPPRTTVAATTRPFSIASPVTAALVHTGTPARSSECSSRAHRALPISSLAPRPWRIRSSTCRATSRSAPQADFAERRAFSMVLMSSAVSIMPPSVRLRSGGRTRRRRGPSSRPSNGSGSSALPRSDAPSRSDK